MAEKQKKSKWSTKYELGTVYQSEILRAARRAVLAPLHGDAGAESNKCRQSVRMTQRVWRTQLKALKQARQAPLLSASFRQAWNCRPSFVATTPSGHYCRQHSFCPFCWARRMDALYQRLVPIVGDDTVTVCTLKLRRPATATNPDGSPKFPLEGALQYRKLYRGKEFHAIARQAKDPKRVGMAEWLVISPDVDAEGMYWISVRQIWHGVQASAFEELQEHLLTGKLMFAHWVNSGLPLLEAVTSMCQYPASLLRAPVEQVAPVLALQRQYQFAAMLGGFRKAKELAST